MPTRLLAVRSAVVAAVAALPEFVGPPKVTTMVSFKATIDREFMYTRRSRYTHKTAAMRTGTNPRHERGMFELVLWVQSPGKDGVAAATRVLVLGAAVEAWVSSHKTGVGGAYTLRVEGDGELNDGQGDRGGLAEYVLPIEYDARLES